MPLARSPLGGACEVMPVAPPCVWTSTEMDFLRISSAAAVFSAVSAAAVEPLGAAPPASIAATEPTAVLHIHCRRVSAPASLQQSMPSSAFVLSPSALPRRNRLYTAGPTAQATGGHHGEGTLRLHRRRPHGFADGAAAHRGGLRAHHLRQERGRDGAAGGAGRGARRLGRASGFRGPNRVREPAHP